jgi:hypothetical protein
MISAVPERDAGTRTGTALLLVAAVVAVAGAVLLVVGLLGTSHASETRDRAARLRRQAAGIAVHTRRIERGSDSPITKAETVATSVSEIVDAGDTVIGKAQSTTGVLSRAVDLANRGDVSAARGVYRGAAATAVQEVQAELARARAAQAAAQRAVDDLLGKHA